MNKLFLFLLGFGIFSSCEEEPKKEKEINWSNESSIELNKSLSEEEEINIQLYLAQHTEWPMTKTGSGLRYFFIEKGKGASPKPEEIAQVEYRISLLDGTECYKTAKDEFNEFKIDHSDIESGVQEALKMMHVGDRVKLIVPSHIAHGLIGDMQKIPPMSPLVIDIHLIGITK